MQKPVLCIVPGWGGSRETWEKFIASAEANFDVYCIELPGFGGVASPQSVWGVEQYGEYVFLQLAEIKKENPGKKIILLGHSFGGQVATYVASWHGDVFDELVLISAAVVRPKRRLKRWIFGILTRVIKAILRTQEENTRITHMKKKIYSTIFSTDYTDTSGIQREIFKKVIREDAQSLLPKIKKQVLIFWGKNDTHTPLRHGKKIAKKLAHAEMIIFPDGRHGLHQTHIHDILIKLKERYTKS